MKAVVRLINSTRGMCAAEILDENNLFVIFELHDSCEPQINDVISNSDFFEMGERVFTNITQEIKIQVYVENVCSGRLIKQQCFL